MIPLISKVVYYDSKYDSAWIRPHVAQAIAFHFRQKGFTVVNANSLEAFIRGCLSNKTENSIIVFSMDKAPDTILDDNDASCLMRQYLDEGGRMVWIGDIPLWHIGKIQFGLAEKEREAAAQYYQTGAYIQVLGVNPVIRTAASEAIRITREGGSLV